MSKIIPPPEVRNIVMKLPMGLRRGAIKLAESKYEEALRANLEIGGYSQAVCESMAWEAVLAELKYVFVYGKFTR